MGLKQADYQNVLRHENNVTLAKILYIAHSGTNLVFTTINGVNNVYMLSDM